MARIGRAAIERGAALRAASRRSPELKSPSPKRPQRSRAGTAKAKVEAVEESVESSTKRLAGSRTAPAASKNSKAEGKATATKDMRPRKLAPLRGSVVEESAGGSPSVPVRRSRAASVRARSVVEGGSMAKAPPRAPALDKGKGKQKRAERLSKGKGKLIEVIEENDGASAEDEERAAESAVPTEIVDESENTVNVSDKKADEEKAAESKDSEDEVLDPSKIIPIMNTLVKEDIADLGMIHQLQNSVTRLTEEANNILCACRKETAFRTRLEAYLRYCVFNNNLDSKNGWVTIQEKGRLDNGWTAEEMWSGGGVLVVYGPDFEQLATETEEDELFWVLDDEEIQESIDRELSSDDEESERSGENAGGKEGEVGEWDGEEGDGEDISGDEENGSDAEPASQPSSPSRKRPRDDDEEVVTPPARRIKV